MSIVSIDSIELKSGSHGGREAGVCLLEAVAWVAGEPHTDHPACACPILATFGRQLNDVLPDEKRQRLRTFIPRIVGTADDGRSQERGLAAADWLIRTYTPRWLDAAGLHDAAQRVRSLAELRSWDQLDDSYIAVLGAARSEADAAWDAAGAAARDAVWDAAWDAARDAAWDAAWAAARDAARDAAWKKLAEPVAELQDSAIELMARLVKP